MSAKAMRDDGIFEGVANYRREKTLAIVLPNTYEAPVCQQALKGGTGG